MYVVANPVRGHKEVPRSTGHMMVTTRYSDNRDPNSDKRYATLQAMALTNIKTVHQTSLLHIESSLDLLGRLIVVAYPRPAFSATKRTNYAPTSLHGDVLSKTLVITGLLAVSRIIICVEARVSLVSITMTAPSVTLQYPLSKIPLELVSSCITAIGFGSEILLDLVLFADRTNNNAEPKSNWSILLCLRAKGMPESAATFSVETAGQVFKQTNEFVYLRGNVNQNADPSIEVDRRVHNAWCSFRKYTLELYDRPSAPLELEIRMLSAEVLETMLYGCVTWSPRACHYDTLRRAHHRFLTRCIGWRKHNRAYHPISYLDTLLKTGSESIEATLRRRRISFAGYVARMEDTRLPKCEMFGEMVRGAGCVRRQEKEWMGCFLDDLRAFGINAHQWTTAAQDEGEWHRTAKRGAEHFMAKWIVAEKTKAELWRAVVCPNVTGRTKKRIAQRKRARAGSLALLVD